MIIGNGSNLVFASNYDGILIKLNKFNNISYKDNIVTVGSGYSLIKLAYETANLGLSGLEFASGIPGVIGGAIYMNAGAYNKSMSDIIISVKTLNNSLDVIILYPKELDFSYRHSFFQNNKDYIILEVTIQLENAPINDIINVINERKQRRLNSQPLEYPNAGSIFRNPDSDYAGRLIEELGYKGKSFGDLEISSKHANFIINKGHASGIEIKNLIYKIKDDVKLNYDIDLIIEQEIIE